MTISGRLLCLGIAMLAAATPAVGQLTIGLEGGWDGKCELGSKSMTAQLVMDQRSASLNGKAVTGLSKGAYSVTFKEGKKTFKGTFSNDTNRLEADLLADGKVAKCKMSRRITESDLLCIRNLSKDDIWYRLEPGAPGTMRIQPGSADRHRTADPSGKLCWDTHDFTGCQRWLPQTTYAC